MSTSRLSSETVTLSQCSNPDYLVVKFVGNKSPSWEGKVADVPAEIVQGLHKKDADGLEMVVVHWQAGGSVTSTEWKGVLVGAQPLYGRIGEPMHLPVGGKRKRQLSGKAEREKRQRGTVYVATKFMATNSAVHLPFAKAFNSEHLLIARLLKAVLYKIEYLISNFGKGNHK